MVQQIMEEEGEENAGKVKWTTQYIVRYANRMENLYISEKLAESYSQEERKTWTNMKEEKQNNSCSSKFPSKGDRNFYWLPK